MTLDPQKKLLLLTFGIICLLAILFLGWRNFFSGGKIEIIANAPYTLTIWKQNNPESIAQLPWKTLQCSTDTCTTEASSGSYTLLIKKENYQPESRQIKVSLGKTYREEISFRSLATIQKLGERKIFRLPPQAQKFSTMPGLQLEFQVDDSVQLKNFPPKVSDLLLSPIGDTALLSDGERTWLYHLGKAEMEELPVSPGTKISYVPDGSAIVFLDQKSVTGKQSLYRKNVSSDALSKNPEILTSLLRNVQDYDLSTSPDGTKILLSEKRDGKTSLYLIDLTLKSRANLLDTAYIGSIRWFPDGESFLVNAREKSETTDSTYVFLPESRSLQKLSFFIPLTQAVVVDQNHIVAAIVESVASGTNLKELEGKLLPTETAAPTLPNEEKVTWLLWIDFSLETGQKTLLKATEKEPLPEKVELSRDHQSIYFLQGKELSLLHFGDTLDADQ